MKFGRPWVLAIVVLFIVVGIWLVGSRGAAGSTLTKDGSGWLVARLYLQARGAEVSLLDHPPGQKDSPSEQAQQEGKSASSGADETDSANIDPASTGQDASNAGVLALVFPLQRELKSTELNAMHGHLRRGGILLLAYSGQAKAGMEENAFDSFGVGWSELGQRGSLLPWRWWKEQRQGWNLQPKGDWEGEPIRLGIGRPEALPHPPAGARILFTAAPTGDSAAPADEASGGGKPMIFDFPLHRGRVWVLPADVLANGHLADAGNSDFLESLLHRLGIKWTFDEYHHGLSSPQGLRQQSQGFGWSLFLLHLVVSYLLAVVTFGRGFGPVWDEKPVTAGSAGAFLRNLGVLHHRMGHHTEAALLTLQRAAELDPSLVLSAELTAYGKTVRSGSGLVELTARLSRLQGRSTRE